MELLPNFNSILIKSILSGFWIVFKMTWWLILLAIIIRVLDKWLNKKVDNWKRKNK